MISSWYNQIPYPNWSYPGNHIACSFWQFLVGSVLWKWNEPPHDTTNKMTVCPVWSESSLFAWSKLGSLTTHWAHSEDSDQTADAQADLSLRWAHSHFVGFVMRQLKFFQLFIAKLWVPKAYACLLPFPPPTPPTPPPGQVHKIWGCITKFSH